MSALLVALMALAADPRPEVVSVTMDNGMRWLLVPRKGVPRIGAAITVHVGSVDEKPGATGAAHLFEHLAFAGTPYIGSYRGWPAEQPLHDEALEAIEALAALEKQGQGRSMRAMQLETRLIRLEDDWLRKGDPQAMKDLFETYGIWANASTGAQVTTYVADLPTAQLRLWLSAEAQRFAAPLLRGFRVARSVVVQELHDRASSSDAAEDRALELAFAGTGFAWRVIGREADVRALAPSDVVDIHRRFYAPQNAVGCLVGDFKPAEAIAMLRQTFGVLSPRPVDSHQSVKVAAPARSGVTGMERRLTVAFPLPSFLEPAWKTHTLAARLVAMTLNAPVQREGGFRLTRAWLGRSWWTPHLVGFELAVPDAMSLASAEALFFERLAQVQPTAEVIDDVATSLSFDVLRTMATRVETARQLSEAELMAGHWQSLFDRAAEAPDAAAVARALRDHFRREDAFIIEQERAP